MAWKPLYGWAGPEEADKAWDDYAVRSQFIPFEIAYRGPKAEPRRFAPWDMAYEMAAGSKYLPMRAQKSGDCVSWGSARAIETLSCIEISLRGEPEKYRPLFRPYIYGTSRVMPSPCGAGRLRGSAGSLGSWAAVSVKQYGALFSDEEGVPEYSGRLADDWGDNQSSFQKWIDIADDYPVRSVARITSLDQLVEALVNGYPCTIASNRGYNMQLQHRDGKSWYVGRDTWPHQQCYLAVDIEPELCFFKDNSWGENAHGGRQDDGPSSGGWETAEQAESNLQDRGTECYAHSQYTGFPEQDLQFPYIPAPRPT